MSDIQEQIKLAHKKAEENDKRLDLEIELKEANDSIVWWESRFNAVERDNKDLQNRIDKALEYTNQFINFKTSRIDEWENVELVLETIVSLLKGDNK